MGMKSWTQAKAYEDEEKWEEQLRWGDLVAKFKSFRPVGGFWPVASHWFKVWSKKSNKEASFPLICPRWNPDTEKFDPSKPCSACDAEIGTQTTNYANFIDRQLQRNNDPNPIVVMGLGYGQMKDLSGIVDLIGCDPADPERGIDIAMKYDSSEKGQARYGIQRADRTPLTPVEQGYQVYPLDQIIKPASQRKIDDATQRHVRHAGGGAEPAPTASPAKAAAKIDADEEDAPAAPPPKRASPPAEAVPAPTNKVTAAAPTTNSGTGLPECFTKYDGTPKCIKCHVRDRCIDESSKKEEDDW